MEEKRNARMPEDSNFKQQRMPAWQPLPTPTSIIYFFLVSGAGAVAVGAILLAASGSVVEIEKQYDNECTTVNCTISVSITDDMNPPVFFYYKLENFYQNHRRYVKSRSENQLHGDSALDTTNCSPFDKVGNKTLYPCGLIAGSFFNDSFTACMKTSDQAPCTNMTGDNWNGVGIAWPSDVSGKFKDVTFDSTTMTNVAPTGIVLPQVSNEEFIVWMRTPGLPTFKKLHRKIATKLSKGSTIMLNITNQYNVASFGGKKYVVFTTVSWLGGKNNFMGIAYISVGALSLLLAIILCAKPSPRKLGDLSIFKGPQSLKASSPVSGLSDQKH